MRRYNAPWSTSLVVVSALFAVICLGATAGCWWGLCAARRLSAFRWTAILPLVLLLGTLPFIVRGYTITRDAILVHRPLWDTKLPRAGLESASTDPEAMRGSLRTFGNGGGFSITGFYYNKRLGSYRAWVTDPHRTVVLRYANRRVVLSPDKPGEFVRQLSGKPAGT
jgi:Bacterial PH domain